MDGGKVKKKEEKEKEVKMSNTLENGSGFHPDKDKDEGSEDPKEDETRVVVGGKFDGFKVIELPTGYTKEAKDPDIQGVSFPNSDSPYGITTDPNARRRE